MKTRARQSGLTLVELIIAVMVLGLLSIAVSPLLNGYVVSLRGSYARKQEVVNQSIGLALLQYARDSTARGVLPAPYSGSGYTLTVYNPADLTPAGTALSSALSQSGVNPAELNDDNYPSHRVRVYQLLNGLSVQLPLYFQSGPVVRLQYQFGVLYTTACERAKAACNPRAATGVPGSSPALTAQNYQNAWAVAGTDLAPFFVSTLPLQKQMLAATTQRLDRIRDTMLAQFRARQATAQGNDPTNWWLPNPGSMGGAAPAANQGCRDGWYDLGSSGVLAGVGLTAEEYGSTAWGGRVEYCRDYDADGSKAPNAMPHFAALRIHRDVSLGQAPDGAVSGNNLILTF